MKLLQNIPNYSQQLTIHDFLVVVQFGINLSEHVSQNFSTLMKRTSSGVRIVQYVNQRIANSLCRLEMNRQSAGLTPNEISFLKISRKYI